MSNNIYDILKKFNNLSSVKESLTEGKTVCKDCGKVKCECVTESKGSKPDFLDIDKDGDKTEPMKSAAKDKGAIAEAVARVEQQLAEKYMGFKKTVAAIKKSGSADNPEAVAASIGRKKYGKEKFQKAAATGKKLSEGPLQVHMHGNNYAGAVIPNDDEVDEYIPEPGYRAKATFQPGSTSKPEMGFVKDKSYKSGQTGQGAKPADQYDPVNKKEVDEAGVRLFQRGTMAADLERTRQMNDDDYIEYNRALSDPASGPASLDHARKMDKYNFLQKRSRDNDDLSVGQWAEKGYNKLKSAVTGDPEDPVSYKAYRYDKTDYTGMPTARDEKMPPMKEGEYNEDMLSSKQKKIARMSPPPNKIDANDLAALRAGKKKKSEGNAFSGAVAKAKATGQDEFKVGDKEYKVQEGKNSLRALHQSLVASMNAEAKGQGEGGDDPEYTQYAAQLRDLIKNDFAEGAHYLWTQAMKGDGYAEQYINGAAGRGVDIAAIERAIDLDDGDESEYTDVDDMGIYRRPSQVKESFPTVADAKKRMDAKSGKTAHGTKTVTKTGVKHERNYDADEPTGERGRPKKDKFAK